MSKKTGITLTDVLADFETGLNKQAEEELLPVEEVAVPEMEEAAEVTEEAAAQSEEVINDAIEEKAEEVVEAAAIKNEAVEGLKAIAKTASENHSNAMVKEAQEFGKVFAHSFMNEMNKTAQANEEFEYLTKQAYEVTETALLQGTMEQVFEEAKDATTIKVAEQLSYNATTEALSYLDKTAEANAFANEQREQDVLVEDLKGVVKQAYDLTEQVLTANG